MAIEVRSVAKNFGDPPVPVLKEISFKVEDGDFLSLWGRSGSGKSTLLYIMSSLDSPSAGEVLIDGVDVSKMSSREVHTFRNQKVGFVFQFHYLLPELTSLENVLLPAMKMGSQKAAQEWAKELLDRFGLSSKFNRFPSQLSGGEQQRVAIARALVMKPRFLFADEPTGNLDSVNGNLVMDSFHKINKELKTTIVFVTHDAEFAASATRQIELVDGKVARIT